MSTADRQDSNVWFAIQLTNLSIVVYFAWAGVLGRATPEDGLPLGPFC